MVLVNFEPHAHIVVDEGEGASHLHPGLELHVDHALVLDEGAEVGEEEALSNGWSTDLLVLFMI